MEQGAWGRCSELEAWGKETMSADQKNNEKYKTSEGMFRFQDLKTCPVK